MFTSSAAHTAGRIGWGIIGASHIARSRMVDAIRYRSDDSQQPGDHQIVGVYSRNRRRAIEFADELQLPWAFDRIDDLLDRADVQCVYVCTHPDRQFEMTATALAAGKHVLCETPFGLSTKEAVQLADQAAAAGLVLRVNFALRGDPALVTMAGMLAEEAIGPLIGGRISNTVPLPVALQTWRLRPDGGGVIFDRSIHDIDLVRWLFQGEISEITTAQGTTTLGRGEHGGVEEDVVTILRLRRNGLAVHMHESFLIPHQDNVLEVYGTQGTLRGQYWGGDNRPSELYLQRNDRVTAVPVGLEDTDTNPYRCSVAAFHAAMMAEEPVTGTRHLLATVDDAIRNLHVALASHHSLRTGKTVLLDESG